MNKIWLVGILIAVTYIQASSQVYKVPLSKKNDSNKLLKLVNLIQKRHSELLERSHYEQIVKDVETNKLILSMVQIEKNQDNNNDDKLQIEKQVKIDKPHLTHHNTHKNKQHSHLATKHVLKKRDDEKLLKVQPSQEIRDNFQLHSLQPVDSVIEQSLQKHQHLFFDKIFRFGRDVVDESEKNPSLGLENVANSLYIGGLFVGTQKKNKFNVIFDTGSALTCITSKLCQDVGCTLANQYDRDYSKTFTEIGDEIEISFGSGALQGFVNQEQFSLDGLQIDDAIFVEISRQIGESFEDGDFDGVVGLGYPHMTGVPTLFDYMIQQHELNDNIFTFHLSRELGDSGSQLIFGGYDKNLIQGDWIYHDVVEKYYWSINATQILLGDQDTYICSNEQPCKVVLDTGTTLLTGPTQDVIKLLQQIYVADGCSNFNEIPSITFVMNGFNYVLEASDYILTMTENGVEDQYVHSPISQVVSCVGSIFPLDIEYPQGPLWILGDIFLSKYSSIYDRDHDRVGLALSKWYNN